MSILGTFNKQPAEVEIYGVQFATDMSSTDEITTAWQVISREASPSWDRIVQSSSYTALLADDDRTIVTALDVTLPLTATNGYRLNIANISQTNAINVSGISIPARGAAIITMENNVWVTEAKTNAILVNAIGDQRVRTRVFGGSAYQAYKIEITVSTAEGRVMQNEFIVVTEEE